MTNTGISNIIIAAQNVNAINASDKLISYTKKLIMGK
jgi:hypothetical protein